MDNMKNYERVFSVIRVSFATSVAIYSESCYRLLRTINLPDQQMHDLLVERKSKAWSTPQLKEQLEKRLGLRCAIYLELVNMLNARLKLFCKKLKLTDDLRARCTYHTILK